jgi:hypothetical protein
MTQDHFRPHHDPARSIYDALQCEAAKRANRSCEDWIILERDAVYREAVSQARLRNLRVPTMDEVERAERGACGHCDYGSQWAFGICDRMTPNDA